MSKDDILKFTGKVIEILPNAMFKVQLHENGDEVDHEILCHISGRMRRNKINILKEDLVEVEVSIYDMTKGRIVYRRK